MKIYIMHKFKEYESNDEKYAYASAHKTYEDAEQAIRDEIASDVDADVAGDDDIGEDELDKVIEECIKAAFAAGGENHDAVLYRCDFTAYYDITETIV